MTYRFRATVWIHDGSGAWHFVTLPFDEADEIDERTGSTQRGFGSVRVEVTIGASTWRTSLFPDTKRTSYVLPIKKAVRVAEGLADGVETEVSLVLIDIA